MAKTLAIIFISLFLSGCFTTPEPPEPNLQIVKMKMPVVKTVDPVQAEKPPAGHEVEIELNGTKVKAIAFTSEQLKTLMRIQDAASTNGDLVKAQNVLISNIENYARAIKDLAELEEARAARLEQELFFADQRLREERFNNNLETLSWKLISILALVVGL